MTDRQTDRQTPTGLQSPRALRRVQKTLSERPGARSKPPVGPAEEKLSHPFLELVRARLREFYREPGILFWVFGFPLVMALALGIAFRQKQPSLPEVAVVRSGDTVTARELERKLLESPRLHARSLDAAHAERELARTKVDLVLEIRESGLVYRYDPMQDRSPLARAVTDDVAQSAAGRKDPLKATEMTGAQVGSRYIDFLIPGLIGLNLMGSSLWSIGYNLVVQRKRRLLRRFAVTPMQRSHLLLSYMFSRFLFLVAEVVILVLFGIVLFGTKVQGSYLDLMLMALLGGGSFAGISLLIGARLENAEVASGWMNLVQLPMWVVSGCFFSYERFPEWSHAFIEALPLTALVNALRAIYSDGAGFPALGAPALVLALWGIVPFAIALRTFKWQ
jgi:ABC-2 type transport system permease protein